MKEASELVRLAKSLLSVDWESVKFESDVSNILSGRTDWFERNCMPAQLDAIVSIVVPALKKLHRTVNAGRLVAGDVVLDLSVRDGSIVVRPNGAVLLYGNVVRNPSQFVKIHEEAP